jgi:hypothetical protein
VAAGSAARRQFAIVERPVDAGICISIATRDAGLRPSGARVCAVTVDAADIYEVLSVEPAPDEPGAAG